MIRSSPILPLFLLSLSLSLSLPWACGDEPETAIEEPEARGRSADTAMVAPDTVPGAEPRGAVPASFRPGTFTTDLSESDVAGDTTLVGAWRLALAEDGSYRIHRDGQLAVFGSYTVESDRVTLHDEGGPGACDEPVAAYRWSSPGRDLSLRVIDDDCAGRTRVLTAEPLRRSGP
ncbi:MAG: hypothetical protein R3199_09015 [Gemmatimonadota bacterium]|nr:hypothetical protein [Gemmatimonadota bacterium]